MFENTSRLPVPPRIFLLLLGSLLAGSAAAQDRPPAEPVTDTPQTTLVLTYEDFGPQVAAHELLGMQWWQWEAHGDSDPTTSCPIKVVVYRGIPLSDAQRRHPTSEADLRDYRYVEYSMALQYLEGLTQEEVPFVDVLTRTRERILAGLGAARDPQQDRPTP